MTKMLPVTVLLCALVALSAASENTFLLKRWSCPAGWTQISARCLRFVPKTRPWAEAERDCLSMGANLASIHSASEYHAVQKLIVSATHEHKKAWIGGSDAQQNGLWLWTDGTKFHYSSWCPGEPNNLFGQACLQINYSERKCWDDFYCSRRLPYVCAMKPK